MANIFSLYGSIFIDNQKANDSIDTTTKKAEGSGGKVKSAFGKIAKGAAAMGTAVVGAAAAIGTKAVKSASEFEAQMSNVATLIDGDVNKRIKELGNNVVALSTDTGVSTELLTDGLYQTISALGDSADSMKILETAAKGAKAGNAEVADSVNLLSAVMKGYGDVSAEAGKKASDLAFNTVKLGQTTFPELAASMGKVIPLASTMKVSQEELFGAMATLTGVTGNTAEVTTQLRGTIQGFMQPTDDMADAINKLGYEDGQVMIKNLGLQGSLDALKKSVNNNEIAFAGLFGSVEAKNAVLSLTGAQAENFTKKTEAMNKAAGMTENAFETQTNNGKARIEKIKNTIANMGTTLGTTLIPVIEKVINFISDNLPQIQSAIQQITPIITMLFSQLLPPLMDLANQIFPVLMQLILSFLPPISQIISSVLPVITQLIQMLLPPIIQIVEMLLPVLLSLIQPLLPLLQPLLELLQPFIDLMLQLLAPLIDLINMILPTIIELFTTLISSILPPLKAAFSGVAKVISGVFKTAFNAIKPIIDNVKKIFNGIIKFVTGVFSGDWDKAWEGIVDIFKGIINNIPAFFESVINGAIGLINGIIGGINGVTGAVGIPEIPKIPEVKLPRLRIGMEYVPYDDFPALLHKGEQVLTASEAKEYRKNKGGTQSTGTQVVNNYTFHIDKFVAQKKEDIKEFVDYLESEIATRTKKREAAQGNA